MSFDGCMVLCGAIGLPAVCDCGISRAYSLTIFGKLLKFNLNRKWHEKSRTSFAHSGCKR